MSPCLFARSRGVKRQRPDSGKYGGPPLSTGSTRQITHLFFNMLMAPEDIAPLVESPRNPALGVGVRVVTGVPDFIDVHHHVKGALRAPGAFRMPGPHIDVPIGIVQGTPGSTSTRSPMSSKRGATLSTFQGCAAPC